VFESLPGAEGELGLTLNSLGMHCKYTAHFDEGEAFYQRAFPLLVAAFGEISAPVASVLHNMAGIAHAAGRYEASVAPARRAAGMTARIFGPESREAAADEGQLGTILTETGSLDEAERLLQHALVVFERECGPDHYEVAVVCHNLGHLYRSKGHRKTARAFYDRAIHLKRERLGLRSPDLAITLLSLGTLLEEMGECDGGLIRQAASIFSETLGPEHPHTRLCMEGVEKRRRTAQ
jgi:tetratricopeptide (TPR) repeat protein